MESARFSDLFLEKDSSDVQLRVTTTAGDPVSVFPVHSFVLRSVSQVLGAMLMRTESQGGHTEFLDIKVKGDMNDVIWFLRYLYTKELEHVDLNAYVSLLQTAHTYDVEDLSLLCAERILGKITPLDVCRTYGALSMVGKEAFLVHCKGLMLEFAFLIFKKDLHLTLDEKTMSFLLSSVKLNVLDEEQALGALWRWGRARRVLGSRPNKDIEQQIASLLPLIRHSLIKDIAYHSPMYRWWKGCKDRESASNCASNRQPNATNLLRFAEIASTVEIANQPKSLPANINNNCLWSFWVDRDILLAGFMMQLTICEELSTQYEFQLLMNETDISQIITSRQVLVTEYTRQNLLQGSSNFHQPGGLSFGTPFGQPYVIQEPKLDHFYVYEISISFRTPVAIKKTEPYRLVLCIKKMPKSGVLLTSYNYLQKKYCFDSQRNLQLWALSDQTAVNKFYYFV